MVDGAFEMVDVGGFLRKIFEKFKKLTKRKSIAVVNEETECKSNYTAFGKD